MSFLLAVPTGDFLELVSIVSASLVLFLCHTVTGPVAKLYTVVALPIEVLGGPTSVQGLGLAVGLGTGIPIILPVYLELLLEVMVAGPPKLSRHIIYRQET